MRRYLLAGLVIVALVILAVSQSAISASQAGTNQNYLPIALVQPTPTASPTPIATATATPNPNAGSGFFKKDGSTGYGTVDYRNTYACGFIRFFDGTPAFGGSDGFHAEVCPDATGRCYPSTDLDASGYYQVDIEAFQRLTGEGTFQVYLGDNEEFEYVSNRYGFDFDDGPDGLGVVVRMDFIECRVGEDASNPRCRPDETVIPAAGANVPRQPSNPLIPDVPLAYCPELP